MKLIAHFLGGKHPGVPALVQEESVRGLGTKFALTLA